MYIYIHTYVHTYVHTHGWRTGKDVLQQPLEQSIASLDDEWGTKVNDEEDWAEKAAQEKRKNLLKKHEVGHQVKHEVEARGRSSGEARGRSTR